MNFNLTAQDPLSKARAGELVTDHGTIQTPIFMPVGTAGTVKAVHQHELKNDIKAQIILGNSQTAINAPSANILPRGCN